MTIQRNSNTNPTQFQHKSNTSGNAKTRVRAGEADASTRTKTHTKHTTNTHQTHKKHTSSTKSRRKKRVVYLLNYEQKKYSKTTSKINRIRVENLLAKWLKVGRKMAQHPILGRNFVPAESVAMMKHVNNGLSKEIDMALGVHAARDG